MKFLVKLVFLVFIAPTAFAQDIDFADLYENTSASVVTIHTATVTMESGIPRAQRGIGSGFIIENDQIVTAAHVVEGVSVIKVSFTDGTRIRADVIASLETTDVALLRLREPHPNPTLAVMGNSDATRVGSKVFIIGSPFGISQTLSVGHLSGRMDRGTHGDGTPIELLQTDTAINTGNSGGPMFNTDGEVIGVVSFILTKSGGFDGIGFATSSNTTQQALKESSGVLAGFEGIMVGKRLAKLLNFPGPGMLVQRVVDDSVVGAAGLKAGSVLATVGEDTLLLGGDLILEINGITCENGHDFDLASASSLSLEEVSYTISVFREGEIVELTTAAPNRIDSNWDSIDTAEYNTNW